MLPLRCSPSSPSALVSMTAQHPVEGLPCTQNMTRRPRAGLSVPYDTLPSLNLKEKNSLFCNNFLDGDKTSVCLLRVARPNQNAVLKNMNKSYSQTVSSDVDFGVYTNGFV